MPRSAHKNSHVKRQHEAGAKQQWWPRQASQQRIKAAEGSRNSTSVHTSFTHSETTQKQFGSLVQPTTTIHKWYVVRNLFVVYTKLNYLTRGNWSTDVSSVSTPEQAKPDSHNKSPSTSGGSESFTTSRNRQCLNHKQQLSTFKSQIHCLLHLPPLTTTSQTRTVTITT